MRIRKRVIRNNSSVDKYIVDAFGEIHTIYPKKSKRIRMIENEGEKGGGTKI